MLLDEACLPSLLVLLPTEELRRSVGLELRREAKDVDRHADETRFKGAHVKGELRRVSPEASRAGA